MWCRRAVVLLAFSLIVGDTADRQAVASAARSAIEAPKPAIDLESVVDRAFDRFAEAGPNAFAVEVARFDHSGAFAKQIAGLESQWKADVPSDALARAERIRSERVGSSVWRFHYLLCLPKRPIIASITFVRLTDRGWLIRAFQFSGNLEERRDIFRDAAASGDFDEPTRIAAEFAETIPTADAAALRKIIRHFDDETSRDDLEQWVEWMTSMRRTLGFRDGQVELVAMEAVAPSLVRYTFVETTSANLGVWEMFFYRSSQKWTIPAFRCELGNDKTLEVLFPGSSANPATPIPTAAPAPRR